MTPVRTPRSIPDPLGDQPVTGAAPLPADFADRVMRAVAAAPRPTPTRSFLAALRQGAPRNAARSVSVASHLVTVRTWPVAPRVRARSFALVLGVVFVLTTGSLAAAAAVRQVVPLRLGEPGAIEVRSGAEARPTGRRPAAPPAAVSVEMSAAPAHPGGEAAPKPAASKGPAGGDKAGRPRAVPAETDGTTDRGHDGSDDGSGSSDADQGGDTSDDGAHDDGGSGGSGGGSDGADDDGDAGTTATPDDSGDGSSTDDRAHDDDQRDGGDTGG
jgi:uncharacterized membrane protein YgcG